MTVTLQESGFSLTGLLADMGLWFAEWMPIVAGITLSLMVIEKGIRWVRKV